MCSIDIKQLTQKLLNKPQILGRDRYFNSAVLVPLVLINDEYHVLFQKRAKNISQGDDICFPGGKFEEFDEKFENTAIRETIEELGVLKDQIEVLGPMNIVVATMGAIIEPFVAMLNIESITELVLNKDEVESVFTIPLSFFIKNKPEIYSVKVEIKTSYINKEGLIENLLPVKELNISENYLKPWGQKKRVIVYKTLNGPIWGLTAEIIEEFVKISIL